jgi:preprotein translocase subunit YajC
MITLSALTHIGVDISIISDNMTWIILGVVIAAAVAYAMAARDLLSNTLSSYYGKNTFAKGQRVQIGDIEGEILEINKISISIKTESGTTIVPAKEFTSQVVVIKS